MSRAWYTVLQLVGFQLFARCHASSNRSVRFDGLYDLNIVCHWTTCNGGGLRHFTKFPGSAAQTMRGGRGGPRSSIPNGVCRG